MPDDSFMVGLRQYRLTRGRTKWRLEKWCGLVEPDQGGWELVDEFGSKLEARVWAEHFDGEVPA